jgi:hydrogenase/urease accessory protein HupE
MLYREGLALGLDRDDPVVRNRVRQKADLLSADALAAEPTDADLQAYLEIHQREFDIPGRVSFEQVYFDPDKHAIEHVIDVARDALAHGRSPKIVGDGTTQVARLLPERPSFVVESAAQAPGVAWTYLVLGVHHILSGFDHLLYILAMLFLVKGWRRIVATMTAFTATHSLTLSAAALGWVHVRQPPVEACIALSIVFVAREIVGMRRGRAGLTMQWPWLVSFTFGLMHGFGFAGALAEAGLPSRAIPVALLFFNVGVEIGQLLFVSAVLAGLVLVVRAPKIWPRWIEAFPAYAIGGVAMFWVIQRVTMFVAR